MPQNQVKKHKVDPKQSLYLLHPYNTCLITAKDRNDQINVMAVAWIIPVNVDPPLIAMSIRPERYTYPMIKERGEFVVNIPTFMQARDVLFCGRRSGRNHDKFQNTQYTPQDARKVNVPIIKECIAHLECKVEKIMTLPDHDLIIGEVLTAYALEDYFIELYNIEKYQPCLHIGKNLFTTCLKETLEPKL